DRMCRTSRLKSTGASAGARRASGGQSSRWRLPSREPHRGVVVQGLSVRLHLSRAGASFPSCQARPRLPVLSAIQEEWGLAAGCDAWAGLDREAQESYAEFSVKTAPPPSAEELPDDATVPTPAAAVRARHGPAVPPRSDPRPQRPGRRSAREEVRGLR